MVKKSKILIGFENKKGSVSIGSNVASYLELDLVSTGFTNDFVDIEHHFEDIYCIILKILKHILNHIIPHIHTLCLCDVVNIEDKHL